MAYNVSAICTHAVPIIYHLGFCLWLIKSKLLNITIVITIKLSGLMVLFFFFFLLLLLLFCLFFYVRPICWFSLLAYFIPLYFPLYSSLFPFGCNVRIQHKQRHYQKPMTIDLRLFGSQPNGTYHTYTYKTDNGS